VSARRRLVLALACAFVAGCGGDSHSDLRQFVKESENLPHGQIPPLPEVKPYEPAAYAAFDTIDPFKPRKIEPPRGAGGGAPDLTRRREALEAFPLESLRMVGTLEQKKEIYAIVKTPDNSIFRVRQGNYMGQNFGRIVAITEANIKLREIHQGSGGNWEEKEQVLLLQEEAEAKK
jgi:type IV pilus assembly protein PilP